MMISVDTEQALHDDISAKSVKTKLQTYMDRTFFSKINHIILLETLKIRCTVGINFFVGMNFDVGASFSISVGYFRHISFREDRSKTEFKF